MKKGYTIKQERFANIVGELPLLFTHHHAESSIDKDVLALDFDYARYIEIEKAGVLHCLTVRFRKKLVGYFIGMVLPDLQHKSITIGHSDLIYVMPSHRNGTGVGKELVKRSEKLLETLGVKKVYSEVHNETIDRLYDSMGYHTVGKLKAKWIGE